MKPSYHSMICSLVNSVFSSRNSKSDLDNFFLVETQPMIFDLVIVLLLVKTIRNDTHRSMDIRKNADGGCGDDEDEKEIN